MDTMCESIRKIMLAGVGSIAVTTEKSKDILDELVRKGELTVEQGKMLNRELKHNMKENVKDKMYASEDDCIMEKMYQEIEKLTPVQLTNLKSRIQKLEAEHELGDNADEINDKEYLEVD